MQDVYLDTDDNLQFTWYMSDGTTKTDTVNISKYIDTYTAGSGLSLSGKEFSVNTSVVATKGSVDTLSMTVIDHHAELVSLAGATINGEAIGTTNADGEVSGNEITLNASNLKIGPDYNTESSLGITSKHTIFEAINLLESRTDDMLTATSAYVRDASVTIQNGYSLDDQKLIDVSKTGTKLEFKVNVATTNELHAGSYKQMGNNSPLVTAGAVYDFVDARVSDAIDTAFTWEEFN